MSRDPVGAAPADDAGASPSTESAADASQNGTSDDAETPTHGTADDTPTHGTADTTTASADTTTASAAPGAASESVLLTDGGTDDDPADASESDESDDGGSDGDGGTLSGRVSTPPDDEELPLTEHIEEMLSRLVVVVVLATFATIIAFPFANDAIIQIWYDVHPGEIGECLESPQADGCIAPHLFGPFERVLMRIRMAALAGLLVALPAGVYQTYRFMRPGLYPHERRYYLASVPFSLVLGVVGMLFSYFVVLPLLFEYFIVYTEGSAEPAFALTDTMNLVLIMLGMMAVVFQIPLLIMLAIMMGLTTREWLEARRIYFWGLFLGVAFLFGPDPTGMAPIMLTVTMIVLFEGTLLLLRWTGR